MATKPKKIVKKKVEKLPSIAICADVHIGNHQRWGGKMVDGLNERCRVVLATLRRALHTVLDSGAKWFFVAGDLFHSRRPEPAVIAAVQQIFQQFDDAISIVIIPGNHDMLDASALGGNTACAPLYQSARVLLGPTWIQDKDCPFDILCVPFDSTETMAQHLTDVLNGEADVQGTPTGKSRRVLITHVGVWSGELGNAPSWKRKAKDAISSEKLFELMAKMDINKAYVGNYHERVVWSNKENRLKELRIQQIGTLCPASFSDAGMTDRGHLDILALTGGYFAGSTIEIPGPRFINTVDADGIKPLPGMSLYVRQTEGKRLEVPALFAGYAYEPEVQKVAPGLATVRAGAQTAEEAIREQILEVPIADRAQVAELVNSLWKRSAR